MRTASTDGPTNAATRAALWGLLLPAAAILMMTMGPRQVSGLFVSPLNTTTGIGIVGISFALAVGQFVWGASQPLFGALADRFGTVPVLVGGGLLLALGMGVTPLIDSQWGLVASMGVLVAAGAGAGSFSVLIGATAQRLPAEQRSFAAGFINAGGSLGQFVFAPLTERLIALAGWVNAMYTLALVSLLTIPLALRLRARRRPGNDHHGAASNTTSGGGGHPQSEGGAAATSASAAGAVLAPQTTLRAQLRLAIRDRSYLCLNAGFFTCGFHIAFLITHLPGEIALCSLPASVAGVSIAIIGLANIAGSLAAGALGSRYRMKYLLFWMYLSRALIVLAYMAAPKTAITFYIFAIGLGLTWLATVPPTAGIVGKLFGVRYLATLFGLTLVSHQIGGFFGAWLGGVALEFSGNLNWMWIADAVLAALAAVVNLPIREDRRVGRRDAS
ncbi:MAG: MFS transporter [Burkholderiaceae bacterium]|nr:MFS transporter [Burkholderiaceae bacterium]